MPRRQPRYIRRTRARAVHKQLNGMIAVTLLAILSLLLLVPSLSFHPAVAQPSIGDLRQEQQSVDQQRQRVNQQRQEFQQQQGAAQLKLQGIQQNIQTTSSQIRDNEAKLQQTKTELTRLEQDLDKAKTAHRQRQQQTSSRLRFLQRQRTGNSWATLLQSNTLEELLDRRRQLQLVYAADQGALVGLKAERDRIQDQRLQVELKKNQIALISEQLQSQKANYEAEAKVQDDLVKRLNSDVRALEAAELQLAADSRRIAIMLEERFRQANSLNSLPQLPGTTLPSFSGTSSSGIGQMMRPAAGRISSNFGYRIHPISKSQRLHTGMDIAAPTGTPIYAASDGVVVTSGRNGGYGNCVIIDHGNGVTTLYGHASKLYVQSGERVSKGQPIAAVGSTGLSTGPHLHFEVRQRGTPVDPAPYIA